MRLNWLLIAGLLLAGCGRAPVLPAARAKLTVLATVYPLADIARQIGGADVEVSWIVETGQSVEGVQPTAEVRARVHGADLVLSGGITEPWAGEGFDDPFQHGRILRLDMIEAARMQTEGGYLWLDPVVMEEACREFGARLQVLRPEDYKQIQQRTDEYSARVSALYHEYQEKLGNPQTKKILVLDTDFVPLLKRLGFEAVNPVLVSATNIDESAVRRLRQAARREQTRLLVIPADTPKVVAQDIELRTGLQTIPLDALGSSAAGGRNTYLDLMRFDFEQLLRATTIQ